MRLDEEDLANLYNDIDCRVELCYTKPTDAAREKKNAEYIYCAQIVRRQSAVDQTRYCLFRHVHGEYTWGEPADQGEDEELMVTFDKGEIYT